MAKGKALTDIDLTQIANLYCQGLTYQAIADECNLSKDAVYRAVKYNEKCQEYIDEFREGYADELLDLAVDTLKEQLLLHSEDIPKTILISYIQTALKYSGMDTAATNINVNGTVDTKNISFADLEKIKFK